MRERLQTVDEFRARLIALVGTVLGDPTALMHTAVTQTQLSDLGVSSLKMVNLMLAVESEFDLEIPQAEITPENFHSIQSIEAMLQRLVPRGGVKDIR